MTPTSKAFIIFQHRTSRCHTELRLSEYRIFTLCVLIIEKDSLSSILVIYMFLYIIIDPAALKGEREREREWERESGREREWERESGRERVGERVSGLERERESVCERE